MWRAMSTSESFWKAFRYKVCLKDHEHAVLQGADTAFSAYYPVRWRRSMVDLWEAETKLRDSKALLLD
eukprot:14298570-Alexandrium_andersonii.AAC.1